MSTQHKAKTPMDRLHTLNLRDLESLLVLDATRSLGRAAVELRISVPTLSRRVTRIEDLLGITLFERSHGGTITTGSGRHVLRLVRRIMTEAQHLLMLTNRVPDMLEGEIRVGLATPPLHPSVEMWLRFWHGTYPRTRISLHTASDEDVVFTLRSRRIDAAILPQCALGNGLASLRLYNDTIVAVMPDEHPLAKHETLRLTDLAEERLLIPMKMHKGQSIHFLPGLFTHHPNVVLHTDGALTLLSLVRSGSGIGLSNTASRDLHLPGLTFRSFAASDADFEVHLAWRHEADDALLGRFIAFMRGQARELERSRSVHSANGGRLGPWP
ncbi:LysR family transcriptional regulator [Gluconobacter cerinus]